MSILRYTLPYQNRYSRDTAPYVEVYKPPICNEDGKQGVTTQIPPHGR